MASFDLARAPEASGLAASRRTPGALYVLNDDTGTQALEVVGVDGTPSGALPVAGLEVTDGEALDVGACPTGSPGATCVTVGDIGDNGRERQTIELSRFPEPDLDAGVPSTPLAAQVLEVRYPDGPQNAEALFTDEAGRPWIVTKAPFDRESGEQGATRLYRLDDPGGVLTDLGPLTLPAARLPLAERFAGSVVTGADARPGAVVLRTYDAVFLYEAPSADAPVEGFRDWPVRELDGPRLGQAEAVAFSAAGCPILTTAEGIAEVWSVPC